MIGYLIWRLTHSHVWKKQGDGAYSCLAHFNGHDCNKWFGEQLWI